ncbi:MAG TPA: FtsW/RodA/SpoVE family cell cycle protein [Acidimicrobiales bacterium]|nr:FtsW/RodA/SpoVE family cell cycle protein [Acidimicrobiales bacterium]
MARNASPDATHLSRAKSRHASDESRSPGYRSTELGLLILAWIITTAFYVLASLGSQGKMPARFDYFLGGFVLISLLMHFAIQRYAPRASQLLLPIAILLNGIGYVEIARWDPPFARDQAMWFFISAIGLTLTLKFVRHVRDLDRYRYLTLVAALALLVAPLVPHVGTTINGARLWIDFGPFSLEPVEFAKILLVFFFASYFAANRDLLSTPTQRLGRRNVVPPKVLVPIFAAWGISIVTLGAENDLGFMILIFALFISMLWVATGLKSYVALGIGLLVGGAYIADKLFSQVQIRVSEWLDPWSATNLHLSTQLAYGWFSIAAGGMTGTGLGLGHSGNVPLITSDMIFAAIAEELGFIGVVLVLCLFGSFVGEGFRIAQRATSDFVRLTAAGLTALLGFQAFFIMAGVLRLVPFTGIALPFMAYGGNSLIANYLIVALLLRISDEGSTTTNRGGEIVAVHLSHPK